MIPDKISNALRSLLAHLPFDRFQNPAPVVSVLTLNGVIGRVGPTRSGLTLAGLDRAIERAFAPSGIKAVALVVNSPGGSPVQSSLIAARIRELAEEKKVPVYAFAEDVAASGGYWLVCAADEIYADESSLVGSIGVISASFGFPEFMQRHGVERRVYSAGQRKAMLDPFRPEDEDDIARLKTIQIDIHDSFKALVRTRRGDRLKGRDDELFEGDIWTGKQALALGLIDGLGHPRAVLREKFGEKVRLREVPTERRGLLQRRLGLSRGPSMASGLAAELVAAVDEWAHWKRFGL